MQKKCIFSLLFLLFTACNIFATQPLADVMPLLQATHRTAAQNQQVLQLFTSAKDGSLVFAAGASLVRIPPAKAQEIKLLNLLIKDNNLLKKVFAAVILTAMGTEHKELSSLLQDATLSEDLALRSYAAAAYTILNPQDNTYSNEIINLYIYDPAFAQRAMNLIASSEKQTLHFLKKAAKDENAQVRAAATVWLGNLQNPKAANYLLKLAKKELDPQVMNALAISLAKNQQWTLPQTLQGLQTRYTAQPASTYALALGFMTGNALDAIKNSLQSENVHVRINAARAAAYMAGVLQSPQAAHYSSDIAFDTALLKSLIPSLSAMIKKDEPAAKVYADTALKQISKFM